MEVVVALGIVVALAAAVRSTWSPCGQSMLSQITPIGEASRGHRYRITACWYVVGAVAGGATLGALIALLAWGVHALTLGTTTLLVLAAAAAVLGGLVDSRVLGFGPQFLLRRQLEAMDPMPGQHLEDLPSTVWPPRSRRPSSSRSPRPPSPPASSSSMQRVTTKRLPPDIFELPVPAGATIFKPVADEFYGDRVGQIVDPFGFSWTLATRKEVLSVDEMYRRFEALQSGQAAAPSALRRTPPGTGSRPGSAGCACRKPACCSRSWRRARTTGCDHCRPG